jgi:TetR/AcrR family transcriptional regulator
MVVTALPVTDERAKPQRMAAADRRQQIIRTAMELFARKGFKGTTTKEIAMAAGVNEALIFRHFPTKQDLYSAIIDFKMGEYQQKIRGVIERDIERLDDYALFEDLAYGVLELHRQDGTFMRLLLHSALEGHELSRMFFQSQAAPNFQFIADYIARRIKDGVYRPVQPKAMARAFFGMISYQAQIRELFDPEGAILKLSSRQAARLFADMFLQGVLQSEEKKVS